MGDTKLREFRRLFYIEFTRAEEELRIVYAYCSPSQFVVEILERLEIT